MHSSLWKRHKHVTWRRTGTAVQKRTQVRAVLQNEWQLTATASQRATKMVKAGKSFLSTSAILKVAIVHGTFGSRGFCLGLQIQWKRQSGCGLSGWQCQSPACSRFLPVKWWPGKREGLTLAWARFKPTFASFTSAILCLQFEHQNTAHIRSALQDWSGRPRSGKLNILNRCFVSPKLETEDRRSKRNKCRFEPCSSKGEAFSLSRSSLAKTCWFIRSAFEDWFGCSRGREIECGCIGGFFPENGTLYLLRKRNA